MLKDTNQELQSCIIIDEAHERTLATDILMGLLKKALETRDDLKVVVMSATMNAEKFVKYFGQAECFSVAGQAHPVEIFWLREPTINWPQLAGNLVAHITINKPPGDIILFVPTVKAVGRFCHRLNKALTGKLVALPLYAALNRNEQQRATDSSTGTIRRCVVSTNVAETSLTIDGLVYIIGKWQLRTVFLGLT